MSYADCYRVLGLTPGALPRDVRRAYKRLVLRCHPDKTGDSPESRAAFCRITEAYSVLRVIRRPPDDLDVAPACRRCGAIETLYLGLDGRASCAGCLLNQRRRLLPLPRLEPVRCLVAVGLVAAGLFMLIGAVTRGDGLMAVAAIALNLTALLALSVNVLSADVIE